MKLGRNAMVALAMLLGSDYTEGVKGVGIVNAMEILDTFDVSEDLKGGLDGFKKWLDGFDPAEILDKKNKEQSKKTKEQLFHSKHKSARSRWVAENFPSDAVMKAYLNPVVDKSGERFSWGGKFATRFRPRSNARFHSVCFDSESDSSLTLPSIQTVPDVDNLVLFCNRHIGWSPEETKRSLEPVVQQLQSGLRQTRIDSFMKYEDGIKFADVRSKRLREVLGLQGDDASDESNGENDER